MCVISTRIDFGSGNISLAAVLYTVYSKVDYVKPRTHEVVVYYILFYHWKYYDVLLADEQGISAKSVCSYYMYYGERAAVRRISEPT